MTRGTFGHFEGETRSNNVPETFQGGKKTWERGSA